MYKKELLKNGNWVITEKNKNWKTPQKSVTFAFDTENLTYLDGKVQNQKEIYEQLKDADSEEKRKRLTCYVWAWQIYDEYNGFFMTNDFYTFLYYQCLCGHKFGWCYNAKFDFSQIDYKILVEDKERWREHKKENGKAYNKNQPWTYSSIHNDRGSRYAYKLWIPYKRANGHGTDYHTHTHAVDYRDFMNLFVGGLKRVLESLDVEDNDGNKIRKLSMEYQNVDFNNLTENEIDYCCNDVKGLYFAVKQYNNTIEEQSNGESHIFGEDTNLMTAGGFAKKELLRSLYPELHTNKKRLKKYQREHPISVKQDKYFRENHLYRGGISFVNPTFKGKLLTEEMFNCKMSRFDVNSEYPFAMSIMPDLVGAPVLKTFNEWQTMTETEKNKYECIYILDAVSGELKDGYIGFWYDPFKHDFVEIIDEKKTHLMFEREFIEMQNFYDIDYKISNVILYERGDCVYSNFVFENYELKAKAKKEKNAGLQAVTKLKLNSSYGKLAERVERQTGHYEENEKNGTVHFVVDEIVEDMSASMSVVIGALVTSIARIWILSHIREICKENEMSKTFVYIDTDSIHAFNSYDKADAYKLGGFKLEATCQAVKYIAPKTYIDIEEVKDEITDFEVHTKGVNISSVMKDMKVIKKCDLEYINKRFSYGNEFICLQAFNVAGGKVLIPVKKYLARPELAPDKTMIFQTTGYENSYFSEI